MEPSLIQPYQHLARMLTTFTAGMRSSQPPAPSNARWSRVTTHLEQELQRLRSSIAKPSAHAALKETATRLTQLARTQDGLRFEHSAATPPQQLADQRQLVVLAAWQLLQALEQAPAQAAAAQPALQPAGSK